MSFAPDRLLIQNIDESFRSFVLNVRPVTSATDTDSTCPFQIARHNPYKTSFTYVVMATLPARFCDSKFNLRQL